jgi:hypothetical protein
MFNMCFINLCISRAEYSVQTVSQYLKYFVSYYILKCWSWKTLKKWFLDIFEVWIKELYWNTINFNDIKCNFKALLNIFLHFEMDKIYQRGIFTKQKLVLGCFSPFSPNFVWRLWPGFPTDGHILPGFALVCLGHWEGLTLTHGSCYPCEV